MILASLFDMIWHMHCFEGGGLIHMWPLWQTFPLPQPCYLGHKQGLLSKEPHQWRGGISSPPPARDKGCSALRGTTCHHKHMCHSLSLLEMHSGGNDQRPRCCPTSLDVLGVRWPTTYLLLGQALLGGAYGWRSLLCSTPTPVGG